MFNLFGSKVDKLQKKYEKLMEQGMHAQRGGDIALYAKLSKEADLLLAEINKLKNDDK